MEVVLRPVNDRFLREVVFPAFRLGVVDAVPALEHLLNSLNDEPTRVGLELLLERGVDGSFFGLTDDHWNKTVYRLLFVEWMKDSDGWAIGAEYTGYAGQWEETLHLCLMLENSDYPYGEPDKARAYCEKFFEQPDRRFALASMICGAWDPIPDFPPDQVLTQSGNGEYAPKEGRARADWAWRPMHVINQFAAQLPNMLSRLLQKETKRLKPVVPPERHEVLEYWLGRVSAPPTLAVCFSGLGPRSSGWIREIGALARMLRFTAANEQGVTAVIAFRGETESPFS